MKTWLLPFLTILLTTVLIAPVWAQSPFTVSGVVLDSAEGTPLGQARIVIKGTSRGVMADAEGKFSLQCQPGQRELSISLLGYRKQIVVLDAEEDQSIVVKLAVNDIELGGVTILSPRPEVFHHDYRSQVIDYAHLEENLLIVKLNPKNKIPELVLVNAFDSLLCTWSGPEPPGKLVTDCLGNVHLVGKEFACQLTYHSGQLFWSQSPVEDFEKKVIPCLGELEAHVYEREAGPWSQTLTYYYTHAGLDSLYPFETIVHRQILNHLQEEGLLHYSASADPEAMGIMEAADLEELKQIRGMAVEIQFLQKVLAKPLFAPLKVLDGKVYIFDHHNGLIKVFDKSGNKEQEVPIDYHKSRHWKESVFVDALRNQVYTRFERNGYITLKQIDLKTGSLENSWDLPQPFASHISIRDGALFYLCKDPKDHYQKRLYRWALK